MALLLKLNLGELLNVTDRFCAYKHEYQVPHAHTMGLGQGSGQSMWAQLPPMRACLLHAAERLPHPPSACSCLRCHPLVQALSSSCLPLDSTIVVVMLRCVALVRVVGGSPSCL